MAKSETVTVKVWGDYGCFSRPEFKVERVSYPMITPSAARGILEAIFWKPEFRYEIREIGVLKMGTQGSIIRNELKDSHGNSPILIEKKRTQRTSLVLKNVAYLISADMVLKSHATHPIKKYSEQFGRRLKKGQCHHTPYLGTREFAAYFSEPEAGDLLEGIDLELGTMLFDMAFVPDKNRVEMEFFSHKNQKKIIANGYAQAMFFQAKIEKGKLAIPKQKYQELDRLEAGNV